MSIRPCIDARALNDRLTYLDRCAEKAPEGTYLQAKALNEFFSDLHAFMRTSLEPIGLKVDNSDAYREVEAVVYGMLLHANPEAFELLTAEGFGEHVEHVDGERVMQNLIRDRDFIAGLKDSQEPNLGLQFNAARLKLGLTLAETAARIGYTGAEPGTAVAWWCSGEALIPEEYHQAIRSLIWDAEGGRLKLPNDRPTFPCGAEIGIGRTEALRAARAEVARRNINSNTDPKWVFRWVGDGYVVMPITEMTWPRSALDTAL